MTKSCGGARESCNARCRPAAQGDSQAEGACAFPTKNAFGLLWCLLVPCVGIRSSSEWNIRERLDGLGAHATRTFHE